MDEKEAEKINIHLEVRNLKLTENEEQGKERLMNKHEKVWEEKKRSSETEDHEKQHLATFKRLK